MVLFKRPIMDNIYYGKRNWKRDIKKMSESKKNGSISFPLDFWCNLKSLKIRKYLTIESIDVIFSESD